MLWFTRKILYVQIHPEALSIQDIKRNEMISEPPIVAIQGGLKLDGTNPKVLAVGRDALAFTGKPRMNIVNPFSHPRSPLSDFTTAELLLNRFVHKLSERPFLAPIMIMHLAVNLDGGITQIKARALIELGRGAGALRCRGWVGPTLTDKEIMSRQFPESGEAF